MISRGDEPAKKRREGEKKRTKKKRQERGERGHELLRSPDIPVING